MRRRLVGVTWAALAALAGLALPATTAAAYPYTSAVNRNICTNSGGNHGYGYVRLRVLQTEWGVSGTNYFKVRVRLQYRSIGSSTWLTDTQFTNTSESFPNDADNWWWQTNHRYDFTAVDAANWEFRIQMRLQWWDMRSGPDVLLSEKTRTSNSC